MVFIVAQIFVTNYWLLFSSITLMGYFVLMRFVPVYLFIMESAHPDLKVTANFCYHFGEPVFLLLILAIFKYS